MSRKKKPRNSTTGHLKFGEYPFFDGTPNGVNEDAARYLWLVSPACDFGFIAYLRGARKEQWDAAIDEKREELK